MANEIKRLNDAMFRCDNEAVGSMPEEKEKGRVRAMFCQLNNMSSKPVRDVKVEGLKYLEQKYGLKSDRKLHA